MSKSQLPFRRICLWAGPGAGKTTMRADLFSKLKRFVIYNNLPTQVEEVSEYVKAWAYENKKPEGFDQHYIFAKQQRLEERPLRAGVDVIVTDSPLALQVSYAMRNGMPTAGCLLTMSAFHEIEYPSINIFLDRGNRPYVKCGRFEDEKAAREMDKRLLEFLEEWYKDKYTCFDAESVNTIFDHVVEKLGLRPPPEG